MTLVYDKLKISLTLKWYKYFFFVATDFSNKVATFMLQNHAASDKGGGGTGELLFEFRGSFS